MHVVCASDVCDHSQGVDFPPNRMRSIVFRVLFQSNKQKNHCRSAFEPGASGLPCYCTPPVCVPDVIGALVVWRHNKINKRKCRTIK